MKVDIMFVEERWVFVLGTGIHSSTQDILDMQVYTAVMSTHLKSKWYCCNHYSLSARGGSIAQWLG